MKTIPANTLTDQELLKLQNELMALANLHTDYSVDYIETFYFKNNYFMITELIEADPLAQLIRGKNASLSEEFCSYILYCIAKGIKALHDLNVIHRGVCADNVYCVGEQAKLNGMGRSSMVFLTEQEQFRTSRIYFRNYVPPPESLQQTPNYGKEVDVWSLGSLAFELATGKQPHSFESHKNQAAQRSYDTDLQRLYQLPTGNRQRSQEYQNFIKKCIAIEPKARPTIDQILASEFMVRAAQNKQTWKTELDQLSNRADPMDGWNE